MGGRECCQACLASKRPRGRLQPGGKGPQEAIDPGQAVPRVLDQNLSQGSLNLESSSGSLRLEVAGPLEGCFSTKVC